MLRWVTAVETRDRKGCNCKEWGGVGELGVRY